MVAVRVYVEGGGDAKVLRTACRRGFREFFRKAGLEGALPRVIASGGRRAAFEDFCIALAAGGPELCVLLVVDSEAPVSAGDGPWDHLRKRSGDRWARPAGANDEHCHLMVQCMESWFLADRAVLAAFFGQGFNEAALSQRRAIEEIPKTDVLDGLRDATRRSKTKGRYGKGAHSFEILALIDPVRVRAASAHADRLVETLGKLSRSPGKRASRVRNGSQNGKEEE